MHQQTARMSSGERQRDGMSELQKVQQQEPVHRWEDRCHVLHNLALTVTVCDRRSGHPGLHHGRIIRTRGPGDVLGYRRWAS
jgi:hypothetical protein